MDLFSYLLGKKSASPEPAPPEPNMLVTPMFEQGSALENANTTRIRSKYIPSIEEGKTYKLTWSGANASNFMYVINTSLDHSYYPFKTPINPCGNATDWVASGGITFTATANGYISVCIKNLANTDIIPSDVEGVNVVLKEITDDNN